MRALTKTAILLSAALLANSVSSLAETTKSHDSPFRVIGKTIYLSGVPGGSINAPDPKGEVKEALDNLRAEAKLAGGDLSDVMKITVYMVDPESDFAVLDELTPTYFQKPYPARSPVGVASLPGGKRIEIDAVMKKQIRNLGHKE